MERCKRICDIPLKRTAHTPIEYLEDEEVRAILESVDPNAPNGLRDYALLLFLYNTGARVQEAVDLALTDLRLEPPFQVKLTGKACHSYYISFRRSDVTSACRRRSASFG